MGDPCSTDDAQGQAAEQRDLEDDGITARRKALAGCPEGSEAWFRAAARLGSQHWERAVRDGSRTDQAAAIELLRSAARELPEDDPLRWRCLVDLGEALNDVAGSARRGIGEPWPGTDGDLDLVVDGLSVAATLLEGEDDPDRWIVSAALGINLAQRVRRGSDRKGDLDRAIDLIERAASEADDELRLGLLGMVGGALVERARRGDLTGVDRAVPLLSEALDWQGADMHARLDIAALLAGALLASLQHGLGDDVEGIIERLVEAIDDAPADWPQTGNLLTGVASVLILLAMRRGGDVGLERAIGYLNRAAALIPQGHPERAAVGAALAGALQVRFLLRHDLADLDVAKAHARAALTDAEPGSHDQLASRVILDIILVIEAEARRDRATLDGGIDRLLAAQRSLPGGHPLQPFLADALGTALASRAVLTEDRADRVEAARWLAIAAESMPASAAARPDTLLKAGAVTWSVGVADGDERALRAAAGFLAAALDAISPDDRQRPRLTAVLGAMHYHRHGVGGDAGDLDAAVRWLEESMVGIDAQPGHALLAPIAILLGRAQRRNGMPRRAREVGLRGLRGRMWDVMLQGGTDDAVTAARTAADMALEVAAWCLDDRDPEGAVAALETGRGLVLHAATVAATVADRLREAGRSDLAGEWTATAGSVGPAGTPADPVAALTDAAGGEPIPSDLRYRVLRALGAGELLGAGGDEPAGDGTLLVPPRVDRIRAALREVGADALAYLVPAGDHLDGCALVVPADGPVDHLPMPDLDIAPGGPVDDYLRARDNAARARRTGTAGDGSAAARNWESALDRLCEWAWKAGTGPLLRHMAGTTAGRPARLVLVPVGLLGIVPWHAAVVPEAAGARPRYAVQQAVFSYAASARLLCELPPRQPVGGPMRGLVVGDPGKRLKWAMIEAATLYRLWYRPGCYLGEPPTLGHGTGSADQVRPWLPGGTSAVPPVVHFACHGVTGDAPARSLLRLAGDDRLSVADLLGQARRRDPAAAGPIITLAACNTDLTGRDHDESLTVATAFRVAGAAAVVGARWELPDSRTALLMLMVHYYLNDKGLSCADALRQAQLWMLDPNRVAPSVLPAAIRAQALQPGMADPIAWAGFVHQGR
jgi:tetratricopeptide (TPR) repeat protein